MHFPPGARTAIKLKKAKRSQEEGSRNNNGDLINAGCLERPAIVTNFGASDQEEQKKVPRISGTRNYKNHFKITGECSV